MSWADYNAIYTPQVRAQEQQQLTALGIGTPGFAERVMSPAYAPSPNLPVVAPVAAPQAVYSQPTYTQQTYSQPTYSNSTSRVVTSAPTAPPASCPTFQETEIVRDFHTGTMYKFEGGRLREFPSWDVYESWGSPPAWRQFTYVQLAPCERGSPMTYKSTPAPTPGPTPSPTTGAPIITRPATPIPTPPPLPPLTSLQYPPNLVIFVHEGEWMSRGNMKVLTLRGTTPSLQPFAFKDMSQVFAIDATGGVRSVSGQGMHIQIAPTCDGVVAGISSTKWRFAQRSLPRSYSLEVECGIGTRRIEYNSMVHPWVILLGENRGASAGWFIVPVARTE